MIQRAGKAGVPADLIPDEITSIRVSADVDAESALRTAVLDFVDTVRGAERAIATARRGGDVPDEFDVAPLGEVSEQEWREHWPTGDSAPRGRHRRRCRRGLSARRRLAGGRATDISRPPSSERAIAAVFAGFVLGPSVISRMRLRIPVVGVGLTALAKAASS